MSKKILVVANGEPPSAKLLRSLIKKHSRLVAVDGALNTCIKHGFEPDLLIGDFDSIPPSYLQKFSHIPQIHTPSQQKSDLEKTLEYLFLNGAQNITVLGAVGKRLDHTLTNICLLCRYPDKVKFETDREVCYALPKSSVLTCKIGQILSLIPVSAVVRKVVTKGLKWELKGKTLTKNFVGISNVCLHKTISISFASGDLVLCLIRPEYAYAGKKGQHF